MKVFTAVYKRVYRSLASEFRKIYKLNRTYMNVEEYIDVLDEPVQQSDYEGPENDILPGADPVAVSSQEKQAKLQAVGQILNLGTIDPMWFTQQYLEAHEIPNAQAALRQAQPQPDPKVEAMKMKAQIDAQKAQTDTMMAHEKMKMDQMTKEQELAHKAKLQQMELQSKQMESILAGRKANMELQASQVQHQMGMQQQAQQTQLDMAKQSANHQMQMKHQQEANKQKLAQNKSKETKPNANRNSK
jgi:hypothetical protein